MMRDDWRANAVWFFVTAAGLYLAHRALLPTSGARQIVRQIKESAPVAQATTTLGPMVWKTRRAVGARIVKGGWSLAGPQRVAPR